GREHVLGVRRLLLGLQDGRLSGALGQRIRASSARDLPGQPARSESRYTGPSASPARGHSASNWIAGGRTRRTGRLAALRVLFDSWQTRGWLGKDQGLQRYQAAGR